MKRPMTISALTLTTGLIAGTGFALMGTSAAMATSSSPWNSCFVSRKMRAPVPWPSARMR